VTVTLKNQKHFKMLAGYNKWSNFLKAALLFKVELIKIKKLENQSKLSQVLNLFKFLCKYYFNVIIFNQPR